MDTRRIDLHVHSTESDGTLTPIELVQKAYEMGLSAFAITDHDTVNGIAPAKEVAKNLGIEFITGVELSTEYHETEVHIVGLLLDETSPIFLEHLTNFRSSRDERNEKMFLKLQEEGFDINTSRLKEMFPDAVLTRAHVARYLLEKGYINSISAAFDTYIGDNCRCYIPRKKISPQEAIAVIHAAGGLAIMAHPILYRLKDKDLRILISDCKASGLDGIEAVYSTYQPSQEHYIKSLAKNYNLAISGGSDYHGDNKPLIQLGLGMGHLFVPYSVLENLKTIHDHKVVSISCHAE